MGEGLVSANDLVRRIQSLIVGGRWRLLLLLRQALPTIGKLYVPLGQFLELVPDIHEDKLAHVLHTDVGQANQVKGLHHQSIANPAILKVLLLFQIELNVVGWRIRRVAMLLSLTEEVGRLARKDRLSLGHVRFDFDWLACSFDIGISVLSLLKYT